MALSFAFDASKETPQSTAAKRALIAQLMGATRTPRTIGEGFAAIGDGIVANVEGARAREAESLGQASANDTFGAITAMLTGRGGATPSASVPAIAGGLSSVPATADAAAIRQGLIARGLPEHVADGFLMNFQDESGLNPGINEAEPLVPGSRGGYGLYQLTGPRRVAYEQYAAERGVDPSNVDAQLDFMMSELQGPEAEAYQAIMAAPDSGSAAAAIVGQFLRPAQEHQDRRIAQYTGGAGLQPGVMAPRTEMAAFGLGIPQPDGSVAGSVTQQPLAYSVYDPTQVANLDQSIGMPAPPQQVAQAAPAPMPATPAPVPSQQGPSLQMLMEAAANPWLNDSQKAIINTMISEQMQQQNPAYQQEMQMGQLGIEKAQLELEALRNPRPDPGFRVMTAEEAAAMNLPAGAYQVGPDNKVYEIGGGGTNVSISTGEGAPGLGKLSTDFGYVLDPATGQPKIDQMTGLPTAAPIPGSPAAITAQQAADAAAQGVDTEGTYADIVTEDIGRALTLLEQDPTFTTGMFGVALGNWKGSNADRLDQLLNTVRSNVAFDRLQLMRESSPTGGALGSVTENELKLLESAIGSLERSNPDDLAYNLKRVQEIYDRVMQKAAAYPNAGQFGFGGQVAPTGQPGPVDIDALLLKYPS